MRKIIVSGALLALVTLSACYGQGRDRPGNWDDHHHGRHHGGDQDHDHDHH